MLIAQLSARLALRLCEITFSQNSTGQNCSHFSKDRFFFFLLIVASYLLPFFCLLGEENGTHALQKWSRKVNNKFCFCFPSSYYFNKIQKRLRLNYYLYGLMILQWVQILAQSLKKKKKSNEKWLFKRIFKSMIILYSLTWHLGVVIAFNVACFIRSGSCFRG